MSSVSDKKENILLATPHMSEEGYEKKYIEEAFKANWIAPMGENVTGFEQELKEITGAKEIASLASGTAAMHLALKLAGVEKGDNVFCQSLTFAATANPIRYEGANPIFIDSEKETWNMSPDALKRAFEKYPDTKFVIVVHLYGIAAKIDEILEICDANNAILIEDAAESLGTLSNGKMTGTFGEYGIYSFNGNKIITTSGGGALACNSKTATLEKDKAVFWATQSREKEKYYQHKEIGYNYRMSNISAGIGRGQLKVLKKRVEQKRAIFKAYTEGLKHIKGIEMMPFDVKGQLSNCWLSCLTIDENSSVTALQIQASLEREGIEARPIWKPMHIQPVFSQCDYIDNGGVAEKLFKQGLCLPSDTKMTKDDVERIIAVIKGEFN